MQEFLRDLTRSPVIAAVRDLSGLRGALNSPVRAVFLLGGSILTLPEMTRMAAQAGKRVFVHMDLLEGLGRDPAAVEWCARTLAPDGLISTRAPLLKKARECGLITIQRLFVMDSSSLNHGVKLLRANPPDLVEVLPGLIPKAIAALSNALDRPIIAGGMVTESCEVRQALAAGALAVSSSEEALWNAPCRVFSAPNEEETV